MADRDSPQSESPARIGSSSRRLRLAAAAGALLALGLCCGAGLGLGFGARRAQPKYPGARAVQSSDPNCRWAVPYLTANQTVWGLSLETNACMATSDTPDQVLDWYLQAGWSPGGKCPCVARGYYGDWSVGGAHLSAALTNNVLTYAPGGNSQTLIVYSLGGSLTLVWP